MTTRKPGPSERRRAKAVALARDVLYNINKGKFVANAGVYLTLNLPDESEDSHCSSNVETKAILNQKETTCEVCALGSLLAADVMKNNKLKVNELQYDYDDNCYRAMPYDNENISKRLEGYLTKKETVLIEYAFERQAVSVLENDEQLVSEVEANRAINYGSSYSNSKERLIALMKNIIRNKGRFIIPKTC